MISDGKYIYQDFRQKFSLVGKVTAVFNITSEAYQNNKNRLFGTTFAERFLTVHNVLSKAEKAAWVKKEERAKKLSFDEKITLDNIATKVKLPSKYLSKIRILGKQFSYASLTSPVACQDLVKGTLCAHASLNNRRKVCNEDLKFVLLIRPYLVNPFSPYENIIVKYRSKGLSIGAICKKIGKPNYRRQVQRVIEKAQHRGILDLESPREWDDINLPERRADQF